MALYAYTDIPAIVKERFWAKVDVRSPDQCWPWTGCINNNGYGGFNFPTSHKKNASRFALELHLQRALERNEFACHHCDNPICVNPSHLFVGSPKDNTTDARLKGRLRGALDDRRRERNPNAKLTTAKVEQIRLDKRSARIIAEEFGISGHTVYLVRANRIWC